MGFVLGGKTSSQKDKPGETNECKLPAPDKRVAENIPEKHTQKYADGYGCPQYNHQNVFHPCDDSDDKLQCPHLNKPHIFFRQIIAA
jgi:hypothetical protein